MPTPDMQRWIDKLEIRELIERVMRYMDDDDGERVAELFADDGVLQLAGTVFTGRGAIREIFGGRRPAWTEAGELLKQPAASHWSSNPVIDVNGDTATAETDMLVVKRDADGKVFISLLARYRDRLRRNPAGGWLIVKRTGVSIARPGEENTDNEWARALERMPADTRAQFRT